MKYFFIQCHYVLLQHTTHLVTHYVLFARFARGVRGGVTHVKWVYLLCSITCRLQQVKVTTSCRRFPNSQVSSQSTTYYSLVFTPHFTSFPWANSNKYACTQAAHLLLKKVSNQMFSREKLQQLENRYLICIFSCCLIRAQSQFSVFLCFRPWKFLFDHDWTWSLLRIKK